MSNDPSLTSGVRDEQTVTPEGKTIATVIDGVKVRSTPHHVDHRGTVFEMFEGVGKDTFRKKKSKKKRAKPAKK